MHNFITHGRLSAVQLFFAFHFSSEAMASSSGEGHESKAWSLQSSFEALDQYLKGAGCKFD